MESNCNFSLSSYKIININIILQDNRKQEKPFYFYEYRNTPFLVPGINPGNKLLPYEFFFKAKSFGKSLFFTFPY